MRLATVAIGLAASLTAAGPAAAAFDAAGADIIGVRLGMTEADIVAGLGHQGYSMVRTPETIDTRTRDGHLHIAMSPKRGATEIVYVFDYGGTIVSEKLRDSIVTRFGNPARTDPMTWCLREARDGTCPADQAVLTFQPDTLILMLRAASDGH